MNKVNHVTYTYYWGSKFIISIKTDGFTTVQSKMNISSLCRYDYLKIANDNHQGFGTFCGKRTGERIIVTGHYALITFHSDNVVPDTGFRITFSSFGEYDDKSA